MRPVDFMHRLPRIPRRVLRELLRCMLVVRLSFINRLARSPVTSPHGPVVSLTTFSERSGRVYLAIESIARGRLRPSRLLLWIDEEALLRNLPPTLRRLQQRGLDIHACKNYGPHKKYYPYVESQQMFTTPLATADDDVLYPSYWLKDLARAHDEYPNSVNCYLAHVIGLDSDEIAMYRVWKSCDSTLPDFRHMAIGLGGVIYPPSFLKALKRAGTAFETCCLQGDDLWLHAQALRSGYRVRQIVPRLPYFSFQGIFGSAATALSHNNVTYGNGNDRQIRALYNKFDMHLLRFGQDSAHR